MNELLLYDIIRAILTASAVMDGRFFVLEGYGNDLNNSNFNDLIRDALGSIETGFKKYPASFLLPPTEVVDSYSKGWGRFRMEQYFLVQTGQDNDGDIKDVDLQLNISKHTIQQDWRDMRSAAGNFRKTFNDVLRAKGYLDRINEASDARDVIRRVSSIGNDQLAGVVVVWELNVAMPCYQSEYPDPALINIPSKTLDVHPQHAQ
jgi:hypothetical protein